MRHCALLLGLCGLLAFGRLAQAEPLPAQIVVASEVWSDYSEADGRGLAWDLLREVFEPAGVQLKIVSAPYTRSVGLVLRGEADAWLGAYADEEPAALFPRWNYDVDRIQALSLASQPPAQLNRLAGRHLVWMRSYGFERYLPGPVSFQELRSRNGVLEMLEHGRADFFLDDDTEVAQVLAQATDPSRFRVSEVVQLPLFVGFHDGERGRALRQLYDQRMDHLVRSGALRAIFARWNGDYPYP